LGQEVQDGVRMVSLMDIPIDDEEWNNEHPVWAGAGHMLAAWYDLFGTDPFFIAEMGAQALSGASRVGQNVLIHKAYEKDLLKALGYFNSLSPDKLDVIVITRGGGSTADLSWFDNKKIAEKIALSRFPVITALGHQIDLTITDLVAHTSLKTPTKSAQFLTERIAERAQELDSLERDIIQYSQTFLQDKRNELETVAVKLESFISRYFIDHRQDILSIGHQIKQVLAEEFQKDKSDLSRKFELMKFHLQKIFEHSQDKLHYAQDKVKILDPSNVFRRGYSMVLKNGKAVKSIDEVDIHDKVKTVLYKGSFLSEVTRKEKL
ncbi:MAG: hypothetical protein JSW17_01260, partial [Candidatus Omnitrophota bacterium]